MKLNSLPKLKDRSKKIIGRGLGSGKGKTAGRGQKGQKARGKIPAAAVGGGLILFKKLPFRRGWGNRKVSVKPVIVTLEDLNVFKAGSTVNSQTLLEKNIIKNESDLKRGVKILSRGDLKVSLNIELPLSEKAKLKVEKAGGQVVS